MTRFITEHQVNPANDMLEIAVTDEPGAGGANHRYEVYGFNLRTNPSAPCDMLDSEDVMILFQNGTIPENGVNGVTHEVLLAIVIDRLRSFQAGRFACEENAKALEHIVAAQNILHTRTLKRMNRGVEGTHTV